MLELATNQRPKLSAIANLYDALHENSIFYCNLKGNEKHLIISMTGESDIDILFDENQKTKLEPVLNKLGFKKFNAIKPKQYRDIVDFLALDLESGKVIHLHTHYRLTIGEPYLKGYQLDIESYILNSRVFNEEFGMYCIRPAFELILLYLIESLKLRHRDLILMYLTGKWNASQKNIYEYNWLKKRTTDDDLQASIKQVFNDHTSISNLLRDDFSRKQLQRLAPVIKKEFRKYRLYSPLQALFLRWYREAAVSILRKLPRILARPVLSMRINPRGGVIVAITGNNLVQSTLTDLLKETFVKKMDVYRITFKKREDKRRGNHQLKIASSEKEGWLSLLYKSFRSIVVALDCWNKMRLAQMAKNKGALVICDRYPQNQTAGSQDGPVLFNSLSSGNRFFRILASIELKMYAQAASYYPDIVFNLQGRPEHIGGRRDVEIFPEDHADKYPVTTKQVNFNSKYKVITLVAAKPVKDLLYILKREIWKIL